MKACNPSSGMERFGVDVTRGLLENAASAIQAAAASPGEEEVHKMRVAIRRFQQGLRLFGMFLRKRGVRKVKLELRSVMEKAGELRNYDIALGLVRGKNANTAGLRANRVAARSALLDALNGVVEPTLPDRWSRELEIVD